jgi:hypothetical protein
LLHFDLEAVRPTPICIETAKYEKQVGKYSRAIFDLGGYSAVSISFRPISPSLLFRPLKRQLFQIIRIATLHPFSRPRAHGVPGSRTGAPARFV